MRYDEKKNEIKIDARELVKIAQRELSPTPVYDEDEPECARMRRTEERREELSLRFSVGEYSFLLSARPEKIEDGEVIIKGEVSSLGKPKKEESARIRAEGFLSALLLARRDSLSEVRITTLLLALDTGESDRLTETVPSAKLEEFFLRCQSAILKYARPEVERVTERLPSLKGAKFPYPHIREGQSEFVRTAYRVLSRGGVLYASAPTGTGKTVSALYPALRALGEGRFEKVFYLTPKGTAANAVSDCVELMTKSGAKLRAVILSSKDRACQNGRLCRESRSLCKCARSNRISEAALSLYSLSLPVISVDKVQEAAKEFGVCPYELSLTYAELCDLVICDINYLFDPAVYIRRFFSEQGPYAFLVDEAHNLGERVREAYSASLSQDELLSPSRSELIGALSKTRALSVPVAERFAELLTPYLKEEIRETQDGVQAGAAHISEPPSEFYSLFSELISVCEDEILMNCAAKDEEAAARLSLLRDYLYKIKKFTSVLESYDGGYETFIFYENGRVSVKLYCLDTGRIIKKRLSLGHGAVLFSATLSPISYYRDTLGADRSDESLEVGSPFDPSQLSVTIMDKVSTRLSTREDTLLLVVRTIAAAVSARRGNYMIFSPSFAYSEALAKAFSAKYPKIRTLSQKKDMTPREKREFLDEFSKEDSSYLVGFCVMGGIYSEGIDLAGDSLIGAIIVGIGIPALSYEREAIAAYYDEKYESGKQYAYIYPGTNRVFQAAGRVIRREDDRGIIVLIDDRFDDPIYKKSLPALWKGVKFLTTPKDLKAELEEFWKGKSD